MPDCRKSHLIFQNFLGEAHRPPAGARAYGAQFGASPPYRVPSLQNSWIRPCSLHVRRVILAAELQIHDIILNI